MSTPEFTRFKELTKITYKVPEFLDSLKRKKPRSPDEPGQVITEDELKEAGAYLKRRKKKSKKSKKKDVQDTFIRAFEVQDPLYIEKVSGGFVFTEYGKKIFEGQLIVDGKVNPAPKNRPREKSYGETNGTLDRDQMGL